MRYIKNSGIIQSAVYSALGVGRENAISRAELSRITEHRGRRIREAIETLHYNKVIFNLDNEDGYYIPDSTPQGCQEVAVWFAEQDRRMRSMKYSTKDARRFVAHDKKRDMPEQINTFDVGGI